MQAEYDSSWNLLAKYTLEGDSYYDPAISLRRNGTTYSYMLDGLGSVRKLLDGSQSITDSYSYDAFGHTAASSGSTTNPYRYVGALGYYQDATSGLLHLGARYYNPKVGRFWTQDPIGYAGGINLYKYVGNNPSDWNDPEGLTKKSNKKFFHNWLAGNLPSKIYYGPNTLETTEMRKSTGAEALREQFYQKGCKDFNNGAYGTYKALWETVLNPFTEDWGNTSFQVGGFAGAKARNNGNGTVTYTITNVAGTNSLFYHVIPNRKGKTGPMHNVTQVFTWTESFNQKKCACARKNSGSNHGGPTLLPNGGIWWGLGTMPAQ